MLQLNLNQVDRPVLASPTPFFRSFAALGRQGPRKAGAGSAPTTAAAAAAAEKKPASAYALFMKDAYPKLKASKPDAGFSDLSKSVSESWKSLNDTQKSKYQSAYLTAKAEWDKKYPDGAPAPKAKRVIKPKKDPKDKKPPSPYAAFVKANFSQHAKPGASAPETMKVLSGVWKGLSDADKASFKK